MGIKLDSFLLISLSLSLSLSPPPPPPVGPLPFSCQFEMSHFVYSYTFFPQNASEASDEELNDDLLQSDEEDNPGMRYDDDD